MPIHGWFYWLGKDIDRLAYFGSILIILAISSSQIWSLVPYNGPGSGVGLAKSNPIAFSSSQKPLGVVITHNANRNMPIHGWLYWFGDKCLLVAYFGPIFIILVSLLAVLAHLAL